MSTYKLKKIFGTHLRWKGCDQIHYFCVTHKSSAFFANTKSSKMSSTIIFLLLVLATLLFAGKCESADDYHARIQLLLEEAVSLLCVCAISSCTCIMSCQIRISLEQTMI